MNIYLEYPVIAYKALTISVQVIDNDGNIDEEATADFEERLRKDLSRYAYNPDHDHV